MLEIQEKEKEMKTLEQWISDGEALEKNATDGPWYEKAGFTPNDDCEALGPTVKTQAQASRDATFIADARTRLPKCYQVIRELIEALDCKYLFGPCDECPQCKALAGVIDIIEQDLT